MSIYISALCALLAAYFLIFEENPMSAFEKSAGTIADRNSLKLRLHELGKSGAVDYAAFRFTQIRNAVIASLITVLLFTLTNKGFFLTVTALCIVGLSVFIFAERKLNVNIKKHRENIEAEFPAVIELLTLALSSGETPLVAMKRIANNAEGALALEFSRVVSDVHSGKPFHIALDRMGRSVHSNMIRRFVDALITAMLRGAPVIDVLQRHALEARENQRNRILGAASKAEISMMIPVVFLILPISILFALWPSLSNLNLFVA
jgi:tight adherence protein C